MKIPNREIKFRAWMGEYMVVFELADLDDMWVNISIGHDITDVPLMQFTGLLDKAGKEIYEGDIVQCEDIVAVVIWNSGDASYYLDTGEKALVMGLCGHSTIIGNLYETPNLISLPPQS